MRRVAIAALVAGAVLVPATMASASHHRAAAHPLALVPLQSAQLGALWNGLALDYGSGRPLFTNVGLKAFDVRPYIQDEGGATFSGQVGRYALDYGDAFSGGTGVTEIRTGIEKYTTPRAAKAAYSYWRHVDSSLHEYTPGGQWKKIAVAAVGSRNFAYLGSWTAAGLNPIVGLDEQMLAGRYVLDVAVDAGSIDAAEHAAPGLARKLHHRLRSMLEGHLHWKPATLPREPKPGRAADGPDLSTMILQPSDVGQSSTPTVLKQYDTWLPARSVYMMQMKPAGLYDDELIQDIFWWPTATEATYAGAYIRAFVGPGSPVDLSAVGDNATGSIFDGGEAGAFAIITLTNGRASEQIGGFTTGAGPAPTASDVQSLAQAAADRLDAGLGP
ncbi:MAG TPA: hypothetical protein VGH79_00300 [Gaiellaceae bacterium]